MSAVTVENLGPKSALRMLCSAMLLGLIPLFGNVSAVAVLVLLGVLLFRITGRHLSRGWVHAGRLTLGIIGLGAIYGRYGGLLGMEPGISVLILLIALKAVEARNRRDFRILTLLALFLCLTILFYSQSLPMVGLALLVLLLALAGLVLLESRGELSGLRALREVGALLLMSLPLVALLFVLFPRNLDISFALRRGLFAQSGMNDELRPGSVSSLALSNEDAFRATFAEGEVPSPSQLYWRAAVLEVGNGLEWVPSAEGWAAGSEGALSGPLIRHRILLRPHGRYWLYALDRPATDVEGGRLRPGHVLRSRSRVDSRVSYDAVSRMHNIQSAMSHLERARLTQLPKNISPRVQALVTELAAGGAESAEIVQRALRFFRRSGFSYTLQPGMLEGDSLDQFLFERRAGFCEHYAASFSTLMRMAGVPARVVVGFQGGELNRAFHYVIVRNSDAHAWSEVWIEGQGWQRVDPTGAVAPGRLVSGLGGYLASGGLAATADGGLGQSTGALGLQAMWQEIRMTWDNIQMQWDLHVMDYGQDQQQALLSRAGFQWVDARKLLVVMTLVLLVAGALAAVSFSLSNRRVEDPAALLYRRFCRKAARAGVARLPSEGPQTFARRLTRNFPKATEAIDNFTLEYVRQRYGKVDSARHSFLRTRLRKVVLTRR